MHNRLFLVSPKEFQILILMSIVLFSVGIGGRSLRSLDDCFYARKGIEMKRSGNFFTVTFNGQPTFQNPPLQFWIVGRSFSLLGENDLAARLPSMLMGIGILLVTYRIGVRTVGTAAAVTAVGILMVSPLFLMNARRCMMEIPLTFWTTLTFLLLLKGVDRSPNFILAGLALGAAILTKSVLGLLPLLVFASVALFYEPFRQSFKKPWIWLGMLAGIALGASWNLHQAATFGSIAVTEHYVGEIGVRSTKEFSVAGFFLGYPSILIRSFQVVVIPGLIGAVQIIRKFKVEKKDLIVLAVWIVLPLFIYTFSSARSARYIFPIFPALALCAGLWIETFFPRFSLALRRWVIPMIVAVVVVLLVRYPALAKEDENRDFKMNATLISEWVPEKESLTYLGDQYWFLGNPLQYYADRQLKTSSKSAEEAVQTAFIEKSRLLLCDRSRFQDVIEVAKRHKILLESEKWLLLRVWRKPKKPAAALQ